VTDVIQLAEYQNWCGELSDEDAEFVWRELSPRMTIRREIHDARYILNPNQFVGIIVLPSGRRLESYPKVPVRNLFYMLAVAFELPSPFREEPTEFERLEEILEFVASFFADCVEERIDRGLHRSYVDEEDNLAAVRGRINFAEDVRRNYVLRHRTYCRYSDFTWDIPENQILRQVAHLLTGWRFRRELRLRLGRIDAALADVTPTILPASILSQFRYNRVNDDYRQLHRLCQLFLEGASLSEDIGPFDFRTFLLDMNRLFEEFVTQILRDRARGGITVGSQIPVHLGHDRKVLMRPDIVVRREAAVALVADCKYKRVEPEEFKNHDHYQLLAYCTATGVRRGLLVYPLHVGEVRDELRVRNTETVIRQTTIDLGKEGAELIGEVDEFAREVFAWAESRP
jgi:5-methylcytosine-specific restriction enzyme subunit McrC